MLAVGNITFDCDRPDSLAEFWAAATGYTTTNSSPYFARLVPADGKAPNLLFIKVPEQKTVKNRVHVDLYGGDMESEVNRLVALGARRGELHNEHGLRWTVLIDPEGNEFCVGG
jgi:hypothetical protein